MTRNSLRSIALTILIVPLALLWQLPLTAQVSPVDYVNVLMGTMSSYQFSCGNTYPAIARPWGMNFWTPQTGKNGDGWQYTYTANKIQGFKQTHQPSPWMNDYGQFALMPVAGQLKVEEQERASWFSHMAEVAKPYYYSVYLAEYDINVALSPTERAAIFEIDYPDYQDNYLVIDAMDAKSEIVADERMGVITGYTTKNSGGVPDNFRNYFVVTTDTPYTLVAADSTTLAIRFPRGSKVTLRVASSFISEDQAWTNLNRELAQKGLGEVADEGRKAWNHLLGRLMVKGKNIDHIRTFYSTLYRSLLFPRKFYEMDESGVVQHYSPYNGEVLPGYMYTDTGFWDTFRSLFPLLHLFFPDEASKMQEGLVNSYLESGFLPEWASPGHRDIMIGNNSASVVADAFLMGVVPEEAAETLWQALLFGTNRRHPTISSTGRAGYQYYNELGYVPCDVGINESAARTLEYAYDDWCIYQFGKALNRPASEIDIYKRRALNYKNLYDASHRLMRGKLRSGAWQSPFNPLKWGDVFTEGNSWHYSWSVFHDPEGLIRLMGGKPSFVSMLDSIFSVPPLFDASYYGQVIHEIREMQVVNMGNYAHGNQPIQHAIYLYNYAGEPWKAQQRVREVMLRLYKPTPDGYCGDEDNGQTSAWYVFSALGFYPVCPGSQQYVIGSPLFDEVEIQFSSGQLLKLIARDNENHHPYISEVTINGKAWSKNYFTSEQLREGGEIVYQMSGTPVLTRGVGEGDAPYSLSQE